MTPVAWVTSRSLFFMHELDHSKGHHRLSRFHWRHLPVLISLRRLYSWVTFSSCDMRACLIKGGTFGKVEEKAKRGKEKPQKVAEWLGAREPSNSTYWFAGRAGAPSTPITAVEFEQATSWAPSQTKTIRNNNNTKTHLHEKRGPKQREEDLTINRCWVERNQKHEGSMWGASPRCAQSSSSPLLGVRQSTTINKCIIYWEEAGSAAGGTKTGPEGTRDK